MNKSIIIIFSLLLFAGVVHAEESPVNSSSPVSFSSQKGNDILLARKKGVPCWETLISSNGLICFMPTGFTFDASLNTSILSFNTISPVIAETEFDIIYLGRVILPKGTKLVGQSELVKTLDRVNINFHTIVFPNGAEMSFSGVALHTDGSGGVPGKVKKEKAAVPARILLNTAGAVTAITTQQPLAGQMVAGIAGEANKELADKQTYSISIRKGIPILIYVVARVEF